MSLIEAVRALIAANEAASRVYMLTAAQEAAWSRVQSELAAAEAQPAPAVYIGRMDFEQLRARGRQTLTAYTEPVGTSSNEVALYAAPVAAAQPESAPVEVPQWQPIETAPKDAEVLLWVAIAYGSPLVIQGCWFSGDGESGWINASGDVLPATHWMPLPAAPGEQVAAAPALCACKDRPASACPGEWEPGCDLGNNEAHCAAAPAPQPLTDVEKRQMWLACTIEACSHENCYLRGIADAEQFYGIKGAA